MRCGDAVLMRALVRILGPVGVVAAGGEVELGGPKERCLLTVLSVHAGAVVAEDRLVEALWLGSPPRTAAKTLQNYVLRLRRRLAGCGDAAIVTRAPGYVLEGLTTDAAAARALVADGRRLAERGEHAAAMATFDEALALWRGPALAEFADRPFARTEAAGLDELRASIAEERMAAILDAGGRRDAVAECEKLVAEEPLRERRWAQLMLALYRDERQSEALEACRRLRALLADELGVDPGPEVRRLEAAILVQDPALQCGRRSRVRTGSRHAMACFGRERELATLLDHLADASAGRGRVTFVSGEPGIGKSRLLAELATRAATRAHRCSSGGAWRAPEHCRSIRSSRRSRRSSRSAAAGGPRAPPTRRHTRGGRALQPDELRLRLLDGWRGSWSSAAPRTGPAGRRRSALGRRRHRRDVAACRPSTPGHRLLVVGAYRPGEVSDRHRSPTRWARCAARRSAACSGWSGSTGGRSSSWWPRPRMLRVAGRARRRRLRRDRTATPSSPVRSSTTCARTEALPRDPTDAAGPAAARCGLPEGVRHVIARRRRRLPGSPTACSTSPRPSRGRSCSNRSGTRQGCRTPTGSPRSTRP